MAMTKRQTANYKPTGNQLATNWQSIVAVQHDNVTIEWHIQPGRLDGFSKWYGQCCKFIETEIIFLYKQIMYLIIWIIRIIWTIWIIYVWNESTGPILINTKKRLRTSSRLCSRLTKWIWDQAQFGVWRPQDQLEVRGGILEDWSLF